MNTANLTGIQHIGLPTKDLEATIRFYESLGFQVANRSETPDGGPVVFLKLNNCVMESWVETNPALRNGAIDHILSLIHIWIKAIRTCPIKKMGMAGRSQWV